MNNKKRPLILFYDIETTLLLAYLFSLGKQVVRHTQLLSAFSRWGIICITYCFNDGKPAKVIKWNPKTGMKGVIEKFDAIIKKCDWSIGKNSDRFDTKMINAIRMFEDLPGLPDWVKYTDDLEKQMRRYFRLPSQSLDYISSQKGNGGKIKMEFEDWIKINNYMTVLELEEKSSMTYEQQDMLDIMCKHLYNKTRRVIKKEGRESFNKMCKYGTKDVEDTRALWYKLSEHFDPKFNMARYMNEHVCKHEDCGSTNIFKNGTRVAGKTKYQNYYCNDCGRYAGRAPISPTKGKIGRIG